MIYDHLNGTNFRNTDRGSTEWKWQRQLSYSSQSFSRFFFTEPKQIYNFIADQHSLFFYLLFGFILLCNCLSVLQTRSPIKPFWHTKPTRICKLSVRHVDASVGFRRPPLGHNSVITKAKIVNIMKTIPSLLWVQSVRGTNLRSSLALPTVVSTLPCLTAVM